MIVNRGLPEVEFMHRDGETIVALTLLRCVGWLSRDDLHCRQGNAGPSLPTPEAQCLDRYVFQYALIPHSGGWERARLEADGFRAPFRAVAAGLHEGMLPSASSLVQVTPASFLLTAIKQLKESSVPGLIVRGVNLSDESVSVQLRPWRGFKQVARVNLNEEFIAPILPDANGGVTFTVRPWEIVTVRWRDV
jgi:alpha-mannosidase